MVQWGQLWPIVKQEAGAWPLRSVMEARCLGPFIEMYSHSGPGAPCGPRTDCGLWALDGPRFDVLDPVCVHQARQGELVFGRAKLWGRVFPYEHGWRAQFARPISLYRLWPESREKEVSMVAEGYGIPIEEPPPGLAERLDFLRNRYIFSASLNTRIRAIQGTPLQASQHVHYLPPLPSPTPTSGRPARFARGFFITSYVLGAGNLLGILMDVLTDDLRWFTGIRATAVVVCLVAAHQWWRRWKGKV